MAQNRRNTRVCLCVQAVFDVLQHHESRIKLQDYHSTILLPLVSLVRLCKLLFKCIRTCTCGELFKCDCCPCGQTQNITSSNCYIPTVFDNQAARTRNHIVHAHACTCTCMHMHVYMYVKALHLGQC